MTTTISTQTLPEIIYPDSDGKPMSDNTKQFQLIVKIQGGIEPLSKTWVFRRCLGRYFWQNFMEIVVVMGMTSLLVASISILDLFYRFTHIQNQVFHERLRCEWAD